MTTAAILGAGGTTAAILGAGGTTAAILGAGGTAGAIVDAGVTATISGAGVVATISGAGSCKSSHVLHHVLIMAVGWSSNPSGGFSVPDVGGRKGSSHGGGSGCSSRGFPPPVCSPGAVGGRSCSTRTVGVLSAVLPEHLLSSPPKTFLGRLRGALLPSSGKDRGPDVISPDSCIGGS
ncbi:hypothetical protein DPEC_G00022800 [Dallia pectoralis]|uniref:Uncharacterized protein n=1 Tax=Dallia pectoralis TaxID=75939 RepID=A0ACC2HHK2_DALPE|nr:hypothetical protein DPEC_G00022800 [Dallia pectoralis]